MTNLENRRCNLRRVETPDDVVSTLADRPSGCSQSIRLRQQGPSQAVRLTPQPIGKQKSVIPNRLTIVGRSPTISASDLVHMLAAEETCESPMRRTSRACRRIRPAKDRARRAYMSADVLLIRAARGIKLEESPA
jgi:hypothetical protein